MVVCWGCSSSRKQRSRCGEVKGAVASPKGRRSDPAALKTRWNRSSKLPESLKGLQVDKVEGIFEGQPAPWSVIGAPDHSAQPMEGERAELMKARGRERRRRVYTSVRPVCSRFSPRGGQFRSRHLRRRVGCVKEQGQGRHAFGKMHGCR